MDWTQIVLAIIGLVNVAAIIKAISEARNNKRLTESELFQQMLDQAREELSATYATKDRLRRNIRELEVKMENAIRERDEKIAEQQRQIDDLKRQINEFKRKLEAKDRRIQELEDNEAAQAYRLAVLQDENDDLKAEKARWDRERAKWEQEKAQLEARVKELEAKVQRLQAQVNGGGR